MRCRSRSGTSQPEAGRPPTVRPKVVSAPRSQGRVRAKVVSAPVRAVRPRAVRPKVVSKTRHDRHVSYPKGPTEASSHHRLQRFRGVADDGCVTPPRQIHPGQHCFVTVRAVNRSHRFVPTQRVTATISYCLAVTLAKFRGRITIHDYLWMSNHFHLVLTDHDACLPRFMEALDSLLSRALNALRGITGTNIEKGYNLVVVNGEDRLIEHCVYTLANPCSAHLVKRCRKWKGASSLGLEYGQPLVVHRPKVGLWAARVEGARRQDARETLRARARGRTRLPEKVELVLERPKVLEELSDTELRQLVRERLGARENELIEQRRKHGRGVLGWDEVVKTSYLAMPRQRDTFYGRIPSHSADDRATWCSAAERRRRFLAAYYRALKAFVRGDRTACFPEGTWLMKQRFGVACSPLLAT